MTETASRRSALAIVSPAQAAPREAQTFSRNEPNPFASLNPQQLAAVTHGSAPLLVLAGAGSGKTLTLAARVARLVLDGADPNRLLTFSRRASQEMAQRAGRLLH